VLAWPYKDCVLEGGQTKEDSKRDEVFWNITLTPDDIDRLLDPKVLTNFRRIDADGEHAVTEIVDSDNLIIKGNNLLALHSLLPRFRGRVKLIYIDPPYNTGNDSFKYNDRFNHSTWLTFMRNRLEIACKLLRKDGSIWINIDDDEAHYLKVLCDDIFGRENFVTTVSGKKKVSPSNDATWFSNDHDYLLIYARNKVVWQLNRLSMTTKQQSYYKNPDNDPRGLWNSVTYTCNKSITERPNLYYPVRNPNTGESIYPSKIAVWAYSPEKHQEDV
jgi:adenine-specific DNA-methyltransferase